MVFPRRMVLPAVLLLGIGLWTQASARTSAPASASTTPPLATLQKQAATGNPEAEVAIGKRLMKSKDPADKAKAVAWYRKAAAQGNTDAEWLLGSAYFGGDGIEHNRTLGFKWMRKSLAVNRSAKHMFAYGLMNTVAGNFKSGVKWMRRSANAGSTLGMMFWAMLELNGNKKLGISQNKADARRWMLKAAQEGNTSAETVMGQSDLTGKIFSTSRNTKAGLQWLHKAAEQGSSRAQGLLGLLLVEGAHHVPKNPTAGVRWAKKAATKHNAYGYYALGLAYQRGLGGEPANPAKAWYNFAAAQRVDVKHELSKVDVHLSQVGAKLSAQQLDQLQAKVAKIPLPKKNHHS